MNINITARKFKANETLKEFITEEVKSLEKFHDGILDVDVVLSYIHDKDSIKTAEISVKVTGKTLNIAEDSEEFSKSVSIALDKLKRQLKKEKSKRSSKWVTVKINEKNITRKEKITIEYFFKHAEKNFGLVSFTGEIGFDNFITQPNLHRPGLALAGFVGLFTFDRIQIFGNTEITYLNGIPEENRRKIFAKIFEFEIPGIVITNGIKPYPELLELAIKNKIPIFGSELGTTKNSYLIVDYLDDIFASKLSVHASFVDVYGVGMLFVGKSGIGKSEVALDLVERGHRLVADDVVILTKKGEGILMGAGTDVASHFMEIRGVGIIDVRSMFGVRAIRFQKRVEVVVELELWDPDEVYTRTGLDDSTQPIMDVSLPYVKLPIVSGKNITVVAEVIALNYLLKHYDYDAAKVLTERIQKKMEGKGSSSSTNVDYFEHDFE